MQSRVRQHGVGPWVVVGRLSGRERHDRTPRQSEALEADVVVLPDEPYTSTADDGPEAFPGIRTTLVSGRDLTWYGPSLGPARQRLLDRIRPASGWDADPGGTRTGPCL